MATKPKGAVDALIDDLARALALMRSAWTEDEKRARRRAVVDAGVALKAKTEELVAWLDRALMYLETNGASEEDDDTWIERLRLYEKATDALNEARTAL